MDRADKAAAVQTDLDGTVLAARSTSASSGSSSASNSVCTSFLAPSSTRTSVAHTCLPQREHHHLGHDKSTPSRHVVLHAKDEGDAWHRAAVMLRTCFTERKLPTHRHEDILKYEPADLLSVSV